MLLAMTFAIVDLSTDAASTHRRAAQELREGIEAAHAPDLAAERHFVLLLDAGRAAAATLGDLHAGEVASQLVADARWRAVFDRDGAERWLEPRLERLAEDLVFEPRVEAEVPAGFPAPTPVLAIQLQSYPTYRLARTSMGRREGGAFWTLFQHIQSNEIAMTAPVETAYAADRAGAPRGLWMAFLYDVPTRGPAGTEGAVEVVDAPPAQYASLGCRGSLTEERIERARALLERWIVANGLAPAGDLRTLSYNSPMVPTEQRYFEVQIPVLRRDV